MIQSRTLLVGVMLALAFFDIRAAAQTPANISVVSGNGQYVCNSCFQSEETAFEPMTVQVTDSHGKPVPSATVNWVIATPLSASLNFAQTTTGADGTTSNGIIVVFTNSRQVYPVVASLTNNNASVTFTLTTGAPESSTQYATARVISGAYAIITGNAGATGTPPIQVVVQDFNKGIPNVSVRLVPASGYTPGPSVACATGAGADIGSVLTDDNGMATCTPILGPIPGNGLYNILIGGVANAQVNGTGPVGYTRFLYPGIQVSPGVPATLKILSGGGQSANPSQILALPLVAEVDSSTGAAISGVPVTWSVSPAGAAVVSNPSSTSDSNGAVSTVVTLASSASGTVQVTAAASPSVSVTFTINVNGIITGLMKASGDTQSAMEGNAFSQPLVVQVNSGSSQPANHVLVQFAITGPGTLSAASAFTDSNGRASVTVTAGSTAGAITVTATAGSFSVSFALTVTAPGPVITPSSFVNGAGFARSQAALAPCAIGTVIAPGIAPDVQGVVTGSMFGPLPYQLAHVTISFGNGQAPLYNVSNVNGQQQAAFQVPCDVTPSASVPVTVTVSGNSTTVKVPVNSAAPGIFQYIDASGLLQAVLVRPDGSFVSTTNAAHRGETLRMYATGMGAVQPTVATNAVPPPGTDSVPLGTVIVALTNSGVPVISARRAPGLIGVDEITFQIPADAPVGNGVLNLIVSPADAPGQLLFSNTSWIPIQ